METAAGDAMISSRSCTARAGKSTGAAPHANAPKPSDLRKSRLLMLEWYLFKFIPPVLYYRRLSVLRPLSDAYRGLTNDLSIY